MTNIISPFCTNQTTSALDIGDTNAFCFKEMKIKATWKLQIISIKTMQNLEAIADRKIITFAY